MRNRTEILGVRFEKIVATDVQKRICDTLESENRLKIFTPNPYMIIDAEKNSSLFSALSSDALLLPDGIGVIIASKILGSPLSERITGIDTAEFILSEADKRGMSIFLLGGAEGVAAVAAEKISQKHRGLTICGTHHGFFKKIGEENCTVIKLIQNASPDILFVCFGSPAQEIWIAENADTLASVKLFAGLGGSLDVWAGKSSRAPLIVQKAGAEWLWRAIREPKRFKKFTKLPVFIFKVLRQKIADSAQSKEKGKKTV